MDIEKKKERKKIPYRCQRADGEISDVYVYICIYARVYAFPFPAYIHVYVRVCVCVCAYVRMFLDPVKYLVNQELIKLEGIAYEIYFDFSLRIKI